MATDTIVFESFEDLTDSHLLEIRELFTTRAKDCQDAVLFWEKNNRLDAIRNAAEKKERMLLYISLIDRILNK